MLTILEHGGGTSQNDLYSVSTVVEGSFFAQPNNVTQRLNTEIRTTLPEQA